MLRPVTSFSEMRQKILPFQKGKKFLFLRLSGSTLKNMGKFQVKQEGVQRRNTNLQNEIKKLHLLT
jgi:hypothetical protein